MIDSPLRGVEVSLLKDGLGGFDQVFGFDLTDRSAELALDPANDHDVGLDLLDPGAIVGTYFLVRPDAIVDTHFLVSSAQSRAIAQSWTPTSWSGVVRASGANSDHRRPDQKRRSMTWAQRLKRVFGIDVSSCVHCGGTLQIVASIKEPTTIRAIVAYFAKHGALKKAHFRSACAHRPL